MQTMVIGYAQELAENLNAIEDTLKPGDKVILELVSAGSVDQEGLDNFHQAIVAAGFHLWGETVEKIDGQLSVTQVRLIKGSPVWSLLIPLIPTALIVGLITFGIFKIEEITKAILPLTLVLGGIFILGVALLRKPIEAAAPRLVEKL